MTRGDEVGGQSEEIRQLRRLKIMSIAEATTLLLLVIIAVPLKYAAGWPVAVKLMGPVHGLTFLAYLWTALATVAGGGWRPIEVVRLLVMACVPFGGFTLMPLIRRKTHFAQAG